MIVYADLDGLKNINDSFGHKEGDRALVKTSELLKETFRSSDVLGRLGGDEFVVLAAVEPDGGREKLIARLEQRFDDYNALRISPYKLSVSIGIAQFEPEGSQAMEDLMSQADSAMYENKRIKNKRKPTWTPGPDLSTVANYRVIGL